MVRTIHNIYMNVFKYSVDIYLLCIIIGGVLVVCEKSYKPWVN